MTKKAHAFLIKFPCQDTQKSDAADALFGYLDDAKHFFFFCRR